MLGTAASHSHTKYHMEHSLESFKTGRERRATAKGHRGRSQRLCCTGLSRGRLCLIVTRAWILFLPLDIPNLSNERGLKYKNQACWAALSLTFQHFSCEPNLHTKFWRTIAEACHCHTDSLDPQPLYINGARQLLGTYKAAG